jgi:hypothetical protein
MRTIRLSTAYQLFLSALLLGACLGIVSRQLPTSFSLGKVAQAQSAQTERQLTTSEAGALVCCYNGQFVWVNEPGQGTAVTALNQWQTALVPSSAITANAAAQLPAAALPFAVLEQAQFAERLTPRLFLFAHVGEEGVADYRVRVHKDGQELTVVQSTYGGIPSYTWPTPHSRQRYANLKVEFPNVPPAGLWVIELLDPTGVVVGPAVSFQLLSGDTNLEMYVDYQRSK